MMDSLSGAGFRAFRSAVERRPDATASLIAVSLAAIYFIVQLVNLGDYGMAYDELFAIARGRRTLDYLAQVFSSGRMGFQLEGGMTQNHPAFFATINYIIGRTLYAGLGVPYVAANHVLPIVFASFGVAFLFLLGYEIHGIRAGAITASFFALFPRFVAHAHYNPKDIPVVVLAVGAAYFVVRGLRTNATGTWVLAGLLNGLAVATKFDALFLPFIVLAVLAMSCLRRHTGLRPASLRSGVYLLTLTAATLISWPYLWARPWFILEAVSSFAGDFQPFSVLFAGASYANNATPWYYYPVYLLVSVPLILWILGVAGIGRLWRRDSRILAFVLLWFMVPILVKSLPGLARYHGIRHVFFAIPALCIVSGVGLDAVLGILSRHMVGAIALICMVFAPMIVDIVVLHPHQGSYFNPVARMILKQDLDRYFDMDYYGAPYKQGLEWLDENAPSNARIRVAAIPHVVQAYRWRSDLTLTVEPDSDYIMSIAGYPGQYTPNFWNEYPVVYRIVRHNSTILVIHKLE